MDVTPAAFSQGEARRTTRAADRTLADPAILSRAAFDALRKLHPTRLARNPVIFVTEIVSMLVTVLAIRAAAQGEPWLFQAGIAVWLWLTVLFATFAEAVAEGRGRAQADSLRRARTDTRAKLLLRADDRSLWQPRAATELRPGDLVLVEAGDLIPSDGEVVEGIASVNEAAVTGESAPVIRESGGDRSTVTGGTLVVSDWIMVRITAAPGSAFLDRMIALVEGASRQKTPNEIALDVLLAGMTIIFLIAVASLVGLASWNGQPPSVPVLAALLVTLIPTTIGGLLSTIGIAGMDRLVRFNVLATSGRAVEAAGDVDVLLLDKTGTITLGNRQAAAFVPAPGVDDRALAEAAALASLADETPEGRSILAFARERHGIAAPALPPPGAQVVPFTAQTRISGLD
jgi:K+-transporting ATPase ATPase B chain